MKCIFTLHYLFSAEIIWWNVFVTMTDQYQKQKQTTKQKNVRRWLADLKVSRHIKTRLPGVVVMESWIIYRSITFTRAWTDTKRCQTKEKVLINWNSSEVVSHSKQFALSRISQKHAIFQCQGVIAEIWSSLLRNALCWFKARVQETKNHHAPVFNGDAGATNKWKARLTKVKWNYRVITTLLSAWTT